MPDPEASALAACRRFFEVTNSRDVRRFTDAWNFPHVRISARGNANPVPDARSHLERVSFDALIVTVGERRVGGVCLVTLDGDGRWGIKGSSLVVS